MGVFGGEEPAQLGETDDPTELIRGKASGVADKARVYRGIAEGIGDAAAGLSKLDDSAWTGEAADAYRRANEQETPRWKEAATAFSEAARALTDHGHVITSAQQGAARAIELWRQAEATTKQARAQHEQQQRSAPADAPPVPFDDPGKAGRAEAEAVLADARRSMKTSSATTADALRRARDRSPDPSMLERAWGLVQDQFSPIGEVAGSLAGGIGGALGEMGVGLITNLSRPVHLVTHPAETISAGANMAAGVVSMAAHPGQTLTGIVGTSAEWRNDPAAAFGKAWTNVGSMFTGVGTAGKVGATLGKVGRLTPDAPNPDAPKPPNTPNTPDSPKSTPQPQPQQPPPSPPGGTPWNQPGGTPWNQPSGTPWNQPGGDGLGSSQYTPVQEPPAPQRGGSEDGFARPSQQPPNPAGQNFGPSTDSPPMGRDPDGMGNRPEAAETPPGPSQHRAPDRFGDMGGPDSWLDDGTGRGPDFDDWDDGGPLGDRGNGPEPTPHERGGETPAEAARPGSGPDSPETSGEHGARPDTENKPDSDGLSPDDREFAEQARKDLDTGEPIPELADLSDREVLSLSDYRGGGYADMNEALRNVDPAALDALEPKMQQLDAALDKMPQYDGIVERGISVGPSKIDDVLKHYEPGQVVKEDQYTSTSSATPFRGNVEFVIDSAQGRNLGSMDAAESEVLFGRDTEFLVKDRTYDPSTDRWKIHLTDPPK